MREKYFENVEGIGELYLEKTFLKFEEENVLFICRDETGNRYLCVCYEMRYALKWVLCRVSRETILQMLLKSVTVRECYERSQNDLLLITYTEEAGECSEWKSLNEIDNNILLDEDFALKYDAEKDTFLLNICNELFEERKHVTQTMVVDVPAYAYEDDRRECIPVDGFVRVDKPRHYSGKNRNWQEKWEC